MDFPLTDLMDGDACYAKLVARLHPEGLDCPRCHADDRMMAHRRNCAPILGFRCGRSGRGIDAFTVTIHHGIRRRSGRPILNVRGIARGVPTTRLARELDCDRSELLELRHRPQGAAYQNRDRLPLDDQVLEADELGQNAAEKGRAASRPARPAAAAGQQASRPWSLG